MTPERLRYAQHFMGDKTRSVPSICYELGGVPASTLYYYLRADGTLKAPGIALLNDGRTKARGPCRNRPPFLFRRLFDGADAALFACLFRLGDRDVA